jgi:hypothetical protein
MRWHVVHLIFLHSDSNFTILQMNRPLFISPNPKQDVHDSIVLIVKSINV